MQDKALGLLALSRKGGHLELGEEPVGAAAESGKARLLILASDAADHTVRRMSSFAALHGTPVVHLTYSKEQLGALFGRRSVAMLALTEIHLAVGFLEALDAPKQYEVQLTAVRETETRLDARKQAKPGRAGRRKAKN